MTNKTPEQEARDWVRSNYWMRPPLDDKQIGAVMERAYTVGDKNGYQRALEEVVKIMNERWGTISDSRLIELEEVIINLKAKGGV